MSIANMWMFFPVLISLVRVQAITPGSRIIGGTPAYVGQYAYAAAISVQTNSGRYFCAGTLISNSWILTAGQCVDGAVLFTIKLGSVTLEGNDDNRVTVATSQYVLHPEYNPETLENDIGLIELRMPVEFSHILKNMEYFAFNVSDFTEMWAIGWGQTSDDDPELNDKLQTVEVGPLSTQECKASYGNQVNENTICVEGNYNEGTCYGDTGGPLIVHIGRGYTAQGGIASFISGNGCESAEPSGYIRTSPYGAWIRNVTGIST